VAVPVWAGTAMNLAQLAWLRQDLAAVNRTATPWIIAMSHFPLYLYATPLHEARDAGGNSNYTPRIKTKKV
jgi:hypothetical protein